MDDDQHKGTEAKPRKSKQDAAEDTELDESLAAEDIEPEDLDPESLVADEDTFSPGFTPWSRYMWGNKTGDAKEGQSESPFEGAFSALLGGVSELSAQAVKFAAKKTRDTTSRVLKSTPEQMELIGKAGTSLKDLREVAGVSIEELSNAIDLNDVDLLRSVEEGKAGLPFEVLLKLSSFYSRNDPIPFVMKYSRIYSPRIWKMLRSVGLDTLVVQAERELQFVQIYRRKDEARKLSDEGFQEVLDFTRQAFEMALHFVAAQELKASVEAQESDTEANE